MRRSLMTSLTALVALPAGLAAHEGHELALWSLSDVLHGLTSPGHMLAGAGMAVLVALGGLAARRMLHKRRRDGRLPG